MGEATRHNITTGTCAASYAVVAGPLGGATPTETEGEVYLVNTHASLSISMRETIAGVAQAVVTIDPDEQFRWPANNRRWNASNYVEVEEGTGAATYRVECDEVIAP